MSAVVTQADRRAAAPYMGFAHQRAIDGQCDEGTLVEAFAAHREAHTAGLVAALLRIAEGNLGAAPWQANYERIREVAKTALTEHAK